MGRFINNENSIFQKWIKKWIENNNPRNWGIGNMTNEMSIISDVNDIRETGVYPTNDTTTNLPSDLDTAAKVGTIINIRRGAQFHLQYYVDCRGSSIWRRVKSVDSWSSSTPWSVTDGYDKTIFNTMTNVSSDTTITLTESADHFRFIQIIFTTANPETSSSRGVIVLPSNVIAQACSYPLSINGVNGYARISGSGTTTLRIVSTSFSTLYLKNVRGMH